MEQVTEICRDKRIKSLEERVKIVESSENTKKCLKVSGILKKRVRGNEEIVKRSQQAVAEFTFIISE